MKTNKMKMEQIGSKKNLIEPLHFLVHNGLLID